MASSQFAFTSFVICISLGTSGCNHPTTPSATIPAATTPVGRSGPPIPTEVMYSTISGIVLEHAVSGVKPYANASVFGWIEVDRSGWTTGRVTTDRDGRYTFKAPTGARVRIDVAGVYQPCAVTLNVSGDVSRDVRVVSDQRQLGAALPAELLAQAPTLSGVVFEMTSEGRQPLSGVRVESDGLFGMGLVTATTLTDANGRYVLCGFEGDSSTYIFASKFGYRLFEATAILNGNTTLDIELGR